MFFKKKKPKIDPKIRFQNRQFNQKLHQARTYKRTVRAIPEGGFQRFLTAIGLGSAWKQILALLILGGLIYIVYIPNFLSIQKIIITGMSPDDTTATQNAVEEVIKSAHFFDPQRNLLFLSKSRVSQAVMHVAGVDRVNSIKKDFKNKTVTISITSKYERFLVRDSEKVYDVYNDGTTKGIAGVDRTYWESVQNPGMVKIDLKGKVMNADSKQFLSPETVKYILEAEDQMKGIVGSSLAFVQISLPEVKKPSGEFEESPVPEIENPQPEKVSLDDKMTTQLEPENDGKPAVDVILPTPEPLIEINLPLKADELEFYLQKGSDSKSLFRVLIDTKENPHDMVQRLNLLLSQTASDRYNLLAYIDLRVKTRAFVCLLGTVCDK